MKNFLLIAIVVSMCDSCESQSSEKSRARSIGIIDERDATTIFDSSPLNSGDQLPEFELPEPRIKLSGIEDEQDRKIPARNFKIYNYPLNQ